MKKYTTAQRLKQIIAERKMKQVDIIEAAQPYCQKYNMKLNKNDLSQYVNGKTEPGQEKLTILGLALNVSEAWLMGYDVPMDRISYEEKEKEPPVPEMDETDELFIRIWKMLNPENKKKLLDSILAELEAQQHNQ